MSELPIERPAYLDYFKPRDVVRLRGTSGPFMVISKIINEDALCFWMNSTLDLRWHEIPVRLLIPAEWDKVDEFIKRYG